MKEKNRRQAPNAQGNTSNVCYSNLIAKVNHWKTNFEKKRNRNKKGIRRAQHCFAPPWCMRGRVAAGSASSVLSHWWIRSRGAPPLGEPHSASQEGSWRKSGRERDHRWPPVSQRERAREEAWWMRGRERRRRRARTEKPGASVRVRPQPHPSYTADRAAWANGPKASPTGRHN